MRHLTPPRCQLAEALRLLIALTEWESARDALVARRDTPTVRPRGTCAAPLTAHVRQTVVGWVQRLRGQRELAESLHLALVLLANW
jgi:hypothetical protein